jgi:hypothetical protein
MRNSPTTPTLKGAAGRFDEALSYPFSRKTNHNKPPGGQRLHNIKEQTMKRHPIQQIITRRLARTSSALAVIAMTVVGALPTLAVPPPNDDIANAVTVTEPLPFSNSVSTVEATTAPDDPLPGCTFIFDGATVWYAYTPSVSGYINANTAGSDYDTVLSAYTGSPGTLTEIACNDDFFSPQSQVIIPVTAGVMYYFMVGSYFGGPGGNLVFNVDMAAGPAVVSLTVTEPVSVNPKTGTATVQVHFRASSPVYLYLVIATLVEPTGRGNVLANDGVFVQDITTSYDAVFMLKDPNSVRSHGTGFVSGSARLVVDLFYTDPVNGFNFIQFDQNVRLTGGRRR